MEDYYLKPNLNYSDKLNYKDLKKEFEKHLDDLKNHNPNNGLIDVLKFRETMVNIGILELQKRENIKSARIAKWFGIITSITALISIILSYISIKQNDFSKNKMLIEKPFEIEKLNSNSINNVNKEILILNSKMDLILSKKQTEKNNIRLKEK